jgi:hypothetical protein
MHTTTRRWQWRLAKGIVVLVLLVAVAWALHNPLEKLGEAELEWETGWLGVAGLAYLAGSFISALYWWLLLRELGQRVTFLAALRAYHIGHLGKYVPGKAFVPLLRIACIRGAGVRTSVASVTVVYETLVSMAAGAVLAAVLAHAWLDDDVRRLGLVLVVLMCAAVLLAPPVFNRLARWVMVRFQAADAEAVPPLCFRTLMVGLGMGIGNWICLGVSLWATARSVGPLPFSLGQLTFCTTAICAATVIGFVTPSPGGLGVREWLLFRVLSTAMESVAAALVPLLLRVVMIASEVLAAGVLFPLRGAEVSHPSERAT